MRELLAPWNGDTAADIVLDEPVDAQAEDSRVAGRNREGDRLLRDAGSPTPATVTDVAASVEAVVLLVVVVVIIVDWVGLGCLDL